MEDHFRAFSFVDRIASVEPGVRIRGHYAIPSGLNEFPASLVAEAVGPAAWRLHDIVDGFGRQSTPDQFKQQTNERR